MVEPASEIAQMKLREFSQQPVPCNSETRDEEANTCRRCVTIVYFNNLEVTCIII